MLLKTVFMLKPREVAPWGAGYARQQMVIVTYVLNRARGQFSENVLMVLNYLDGLHLS